MGDRQGSRPADHVLEQIGSDYVGGRQAQPEDEQCGCYEDQAPGLCSVWVVQLWSQAADAAAARAVPADTA